MRVAQFQWLRGALRTLALAGAAVSFLGECAAFVSTRTAQPFAKGIVYVGIAALISAWMLSRSIQHPPGTTRPWQRAAYGFVGYTWFAWWILYFVVAPESGASFSAPVFHSPFAFWNVAGRTYDSIWSAWSYSNAMIVFTMAIAVFDPPSPGRADTGEPPRRLWLLSKRGLLFIIAPPVALYIVGRLLLGLKATSQDMAFAIMAIGGLWFIFALPVLGIALVVSGVSSNPKTDQSER